MGKVTGITIVHGFAFALRLASETFGKSFMPRCLVFL